MDKIDRRGGGRGRSLGGTFNFYSEINRIFLWISWKNVLKMCPKLFNPSASYFKYTVNNNF